MKYKVNWSPSAKTTYLETLKTVLENWNKKETEKVESLIDNKIKHLENNKHICPSAKNTNFRKCVISKQTSLIYEVVNNEIELLFFIYNAGGAEY